MNKYAFFIYDYYYPRGGLEDLFFSFNDIDETKAILNQAIKDEGMICIGYKVVEFCR